MSRSIAVALVTIAFGAILGATSLVASGPGASDIDEVLIENQPGCDFDEARAELVNESGTYYYRVSYSFTVSNDGDGPSSCSSGPCTDSASGYTDIEPRGSASIGLFLPNCPGEPNCDNDECDEDSWCTDFTYALIEVTHYSTNGVNWTAVNPLNKLVCRIQSGFQPTCSVQNACE